MEKEMMEELERQREQQRQEELARQVIMLSTCQSSVKAMIRCSYMWHTLREQSDLFSQPTQLHIVLNVYYTNFVQKRLIKVFFRSYLLKVQSGVVRVLTRIFSWILNCSLIENLNVLPFFTFNNNMHVICTYETDSFCMNCCIVKCKCHKGDRLAFLNCSLDCPWQSRSL